MLRRTTYNDRTILIWQCKNLEKFSNVFKGHSAVYNKRTIYLDELENSTIIFYSSAFSILDCFLQ